LLLSFFKQANYGMTFLTNAALKHPLSPLVGMMMIAGALLAAMALGDPLIISAPFIAFAVIVASFYGFKALRGDPFAVYLVTFMVIFLANAMFRVRDLDDKSLDIQTLIKSVSWMLAFGLAVMSPAHTLKALFAPDKLLWLLLFLWMTFSASYAPNPSYALVCLFSLFALYLFFMNVFSRFDTLSIIMAIVSACSIFALISVIVYVLIPSFGRVGQWENGVIVAGDRLNGIGGSPNNVASVMTLGLLLGGLYGGELYSRYRHIFWAGMGLCALALWMAGTRMSMGMTAMILGIFYLVNVHRLPYALLLGCMIILIVCFAIPYRDDILTLLSRTGDAGEVLSGNNRAIIWYTTIRIAEQSPYMGWGYASTTFILPKYSEQLMHVAASAHNLVLQMWFTTGYVGLGLFALALLVSSFKIAVEGHKKAALLLFYVVLSGLSEAGPFSNTVHLGSIALFIALSVPKKMLNKSTHS
jgi:O-antigen ligase